MLHLHEAISPSLLDAHGCDGYINGLEIASAMAEAFEDDDDDDEAGAAEEVLRSI